MENGPYQRNSLSWRFRFGSIRFGPFRFVFGSFRSCSLLFRFPSSSLVGRVLGCGTPMVQCSSFTIFGIVRFDSGSGGGGIEGGLWGWMGTDGGALWSLVGRANGVHLLFSRMSVDCVSSAVHPSG